MRYQLYLLNGFNANGFTAETSIREGHQEAQFAHAGDWGGVARLDCEPWLGTIVGGSAQTTRSANTLTSTVGSAGQPLRGRRAHAHRRVHRARRSGVPVHRRRGGAERHPRRRARGRRHRAGIRWRCSCAAATSRRATRSSRVLAPGNEQSVTLFGRFDYADTQASVPSGFVANPAFRRNDLHRRPHLSAGDADRAQLTTAGICSEWAARAGTRLRRQSPGCSEGERNGCRRACSCPCPCSSPFPCWCPCPCSCRVPRHR